MMNSLTIKTYSEDKRETEFFQAILTLAGSVLTHDWKISNNEMADVFIISFDAKKTSQTWVEYAEKYPVERLVAYTDENAIIGAKWHLPRAPESMPRLSEVVKILNNVGHYFCELNEQEQESAASTAPQSNQQTSPGTPIGLDPIAPAQEIKSTHFHLNDYLAGAIHQAIEQAERKAYSLQGYPTIYLSPEENAIYTAADPIALSILCRTPMSAIEVSDFPESELSKDSPFGGAVKRRSLSEFLWFSILTGSNGKILADYCESEPVHLREWPGYVRLPFYSLYHDIATQMASGIASLAEIAQATASPIQNVIDFHNACAFLGLIVHGEEGHKLAAQKSNSRAYLRSVFQSHGIDKSYLRLILVGNVGAGKTTALTTLSETPPILTETSPSDKVAALKSTTTIAMEYGEIRLGDDSKLQIYGTPGQKRFDFMGKILCPKAWGLLILLDNTSPAPLDDLKYYIETYAVNFENGNVAIGVSHYDAKQNPSFEDYENFLAHNGYPFNLGVVDTRDIYSLVLLVSTMVKPQSGF